MSVSKGPRFGGPSSSQLTPEPDETPVEGRERRKTLGKLPSCQPVKGVGSRPRLFSVEPPLRPRSLPVRSFEGPRGLVARSDRRNITTFL